jgi:hypothetical protein
MESVKQTSAVSFDIVLDENAVKPEPKRMILMKNRQTKPLTADEIEQRQKLAEERRRVYEMLLIKAHLICFEYFKFHF